MSVCLAKGVATHFVDFGRRRPLAFVERFVQHVVELAVARAARLVRVTLAHRLLVARIVFLYHLQNISSSSLTVSWNSVHKL